jgi:hypothetical protein
MKNCAPRCSELSERPRSRCATAAALRRLAAALTFSAAALAAESPAPIQLTDVTRETGIDFIHSDGSSGQRYIVETVSAGLATFDYNGDGRIDILFLNGTALPGSTNAPSTCRLYRNEGNWKFTDVTKSAGLAVPCYALGVAIGDYDNDGHPDIYLNNFGTNLLFRNRGDGTFENTTARAGVADDPEHVGAGTCFLDIDGDGDLDLFVGHYVNFTFAKHHFVRFNGHPAYVGPLNYPATTDRLFRNNGDGTFTDVSVESGIAAHRGAAMGMVCADFDQDGDTDIFVGNDEIGNALFVNDGHGHFEETGLRSGIAYDLNGQAHGTMGVECGDFDNDGRLDIFATSYQGESPVLFRNLGNGLFEDVSAAARANANMRPLVTWGCGMIDFDNDGFRDLFIAAGHLHDNVELFDTSTSYFQQNRLLRNLGTGRFEEVTQSAGDGLAVKLSSRGAAFDDLDNDGDLDVVILNARREPTVLRNDSPRGNHWLQVQLRGTKSNRDGVGARVTVVAGDRSWVDEVHSGRSYQSHYGSRLQFGLGKRDRVDRIEVRWIGGGVTQIESPGIDRLVSIVETTAPPASAR